MKGAVWRLKKQQTIGNGGLEVPQDTLHSLKVERGGWPVQELRDFVDSKRDVATVRDRYCRAPTKPW